MRRSANLFWRVFLGVLSVALAGVLAVGLVTRYVLNIAFEAYLATLPVTRPGMGMGRRMMLGRTEQTFLDSVDRSALIAGVLVIAAAVVAAWLIARSIARPIRELENAALAFAAGDLSSRVKTDGPEEVIALGEAFNHMADSLARAEELRRRMVADVAHELRNPIAAARAQAEAMAEGVMVASPDRARSIVQDMEHLTGLVEDLQQLALAEAGELRYEKCLFDISDLVRAEVSRAQAAAGPGVTVSVEGASGPIPVMADDRRISEVLRNLLGNATRHTRDGSITVRLERTGDRVSVSVIDTGEGISDADLPNVFERFYRADSARSAKTGGAGLGLAIARRIVEDHGGTAFARHTPGGGATVGFTLPLG